MSAYGTPQVQVAWTGQLTGVFTIGTSTIGGTDVIGGAFGGNVFDDLTADTLSVTCRRGRASDMAAMEQGTCLIRLKDADGTYNPENAASSLADYLDVMRPVRVRETYGGTTYGLFYGYISQVEYDPSTKQAIIEAVDFFEWLSGVRPTVAELTSQTVGYIIGAILDAVGWTDPVLRDIDSGGSTIPSWEATGASTALTLVENLLQIDLGAVFVDGDGVVTYQTRNARYANGTPVATLSGSLVGGLKTSISVRSIINGQTVQRTGGTAQTATDEASRLARGYRDGAAIESAYLESDTQALSLARWVVAVNATPRPPARGVRLINRDETTLLQQLSREIGDLVTVSEPVGGTSFNGRIQAIEHTISEAGKVHETTLAVQKVTVSAFTIGTSTIGGTDVIAY